MDKATARELLEKLHSKLLEDILYTELISDGRGFVDYNIYLIEKESGDQWDDEVALQRVTLLQDTALIPPRALDD